MTFRSLFELRPSPVRWPVALQAAFAIGIPAVGFALAGQAETGLLASTGGFVALYLTTRSRRERAAKLPLIALGLLASAALGVLASADLLASLIAVFVIAVASSTLCLGLGVGPPGALFFVLVGGVSSHLAAPATLGGGGLDGARLLLLVALGLVIAYLVVLVPLTAPSVRDRDAALHAQKQGMRFDFDPTTRVVLARLIVATAIATAVAAPLGLHRAYWVVLTVVVILQNGHAVRLTMLRGIHRVLGTFVGLAVFAALSLLHPAGLLLAVIVVVLQFVVEMVIIRNYGLALIFITPLALSISAQGSAKQVDALIVDRIVDTLIGTAIALVVLFAAPLAGRVKARFQGR